MCESAACGLLGFLDLRWFLWLVICVILLLFWVCDLPLVFDFGIVLGFVVVCFVWLGF